jgi:NAD(P)-dependent dehydrogenase (short-subunit alcohol dehydrogenase family)
MTSSTPVALVTGGTTGIGLAAALELHKRGYAVVVTGRNPETLAAAKQTLPEDVVVFRADASSLADADAVADELRQRFGRLDLAFLNAGIAAIAPLHVLDEETYDRHFDINVKGQVFMLQKVLPLLGQGSSVILTSSSITDKVQPGMAVYAATKGAQISLVRSLAVELAPMGVRVNAVSPGPIETAAHGKLNLPAEEAEKFKDTVSAQVPLGRFGESEEIGRVVAYLASPEASYITGANIVIDGGMSVN